MDRHAVLVVDDDQSMRDLLRTSLEGQGFAVQCAGDAEVALEALGADQFDLVLLDLALPGAYGLEVIRRLRQRRPAGRPAIVVVSGIHASYLSAIRACGADDVVLKPFDLDDLLARVRACLAARTQVG